MPRFIAKPAYSVGEITQLLNAFEETKRRAKGEQRKIWNRKSSRTFLKAFGILPRGAGERCKAFVTFAQLREMAPGLVDGIMVIDALEDAQNAA